MRLFFVCFVFFDQPQLFLPAQSLEVPFPAQRFLLIGIFFGINQRYRSPAVGIFGSILTIVRFDPLLQIRGPTAVECPVCAAEQIDIVHLQSKWITFSIRSVAFTLGLW